MGVSTGIGFLNSKRQADEAKRVAKMNAELGANDTLFSPFVRQQSQKMAQPDAGPGALGGAFQGVLSGFNQAQLVDKAGGSDNIYQSLMGDPGNPDSVNQAVETITKKPIFEAPTLGGMLAKQPQYALLDRKSRSPF
jgi:hypothetical protein